MLKGNTAEGYTVDETVVSAANSGGSSGDAANAMTIGASATFVADDDQPIKGTWVYRVATGASAVQTRWDWTFTAVPTIRFRLYLITPSSFSTAPTFGRMLSGGGANQVVRFGWNASGNILIRNAANTTVATSTLALSTSTAYRIEGYCTQGVSGTAEIKIYASVDSTTATETLTADAQNFGTVDIDQMSYGQVAGLANVPSWFMDCLAVSDGTSYIGPFSVSVSSEVATGTGTASNASVTVSPSAGSASGAGTASNAAGSVRPSAGVATGTGTTGQPTGAVASGAGVASGTGTANSAAGAVSPSAGVATGTGATNTATGSLGVPCGAATGTGAANGATASVAALAGYALASGLAHPPTINLGVLPTAATGTGTALDPTVDTTAADQSPAGTPVVAYGRAGVIRDRTRPGRLVATGGTR